MVSSLNKKWKEDNEKLHVIQGVVRKQECLLNYLSVTAVLLNTIQWRRSLNNLADRSYPVANEKEIIKLFILTF